MCPSWLQMYVSYALVQGKYCNNELFLETFGHRRHNGLLSVTLNGAVCACTLRRHDTHHLRNNSTELDSDRQAKAFVDVDVDDVVRLFWNKCTIALIICVCGMRVYGLMGLAFNSPPEHCRASLNVVRFVVLDRRITAKTKAFRLPLREKKHTLSTIESRSWAGPHFRQQTEPMHGQREISPVVQWKPSKKWNASENPVLSQNYYRNQSIEFVYFKWIGLLWKIDKFPLVSLQSDTSW